MEACAHHLSNQRRSCGGIARDARLFWKYKSRAASSKPKIPAETVALIKEMAAQNRLWGAERMRGELLKPGIRVCKRTIQKYMRNARIPRRRRQNWATYLQNHAKDIWACDFLQVTDLFFRSLFAFFIIDMQSRKVIHVGVTRSPTDTWTAQQLREATPYGQSPNYLIRDRDNIFGSCFARVAATSGIKMLTTPYHAPRANAICERFLGSVRRECLDHLFILQEKQLHRVLQPMSSTSIEPDRIKASNNRFQNGMVSLSLQITMVARYSPSQSWVDCTMITAEALDL
jgi:putative transposase